MGVSIVRELRVCSDCLYIVAYGVESEEQETTFASWPEWARTNGMSLVVSCGGEDGCDHGFTWSPCELCGQGGIEPHDVVEFDA